MGEENMGRGIGSGGIRQDGIRSIVEGSQLKRWLIDLFLRFIGRWFAKAAPKAAKQVDRGIDEIIPDPQTPEEVWHNINIQKREKSRRIAEMNRPKR